MVAWPFNGEGIAITAALQKEPAPGDVATIVAPFGAVVANSLDLLKAMEVVLVRHHNHWMAAKWLHIEHAPLRGHLAVNDEESICGVSGQNIKELNALEVLAFGIEVPQGSQLFVEVVFLTGFPGKRPRNHRSELKFIALTLDTENPTVAEIDHFTSDFQVDGLRISNDEIERFSFVYAVWAECDTKRHVVRASTEDFPSKRLGLRHRLLLSPFGPGRIRHQSPGWQALPVLPYGVAWVVASDDNLRPLLNRSLSTR